jgi:hypothetical protein
MQNPVAIRRIYFRQKSWGDYLDTWVEPVPSWRGSLKEPVEIPLLLLVVL